MKYKMLILPALALAALPAQAQNNAPVGADNTALNKRDRQASTLTPADQAKGTDADVEITRRIRELVMKDSTLSNDAQNVKIITLRGVTTLRGPVENVEERSKIGSIAMQVAGAKAVRNQLEIKK